jgi:hypothetical protein
LASSSGGKRRHSSLLDTLMHDPSVSVRLAAINALKRFAASDDVRGAPGKRLTAAVVRHDRCV